MNCNQITKFDKNNNLNFFKIENRSEIKTKKVTFFWNFKLLFIIIFCNIWKFKQLLIFKSKKFFLHSKIKKFLLFYIDFGVNYFIVKIGCSLFSSPIGISKKVKISQFLTNSGRVRPKVEFLPIFLSWAILNRFGRSISVVQINIIRLFGFFSRVQG